MIKSALLVALLTVPAAQTAPVGKYLFEEHCGICHKNEPNGIPLREEIAAYSRKKIIEALLDGAMQIQAIELNKEQVEAVADYVKSLEKK